MHIDLAEHSLLKLGVAQGDIGIVLLPSQTSHSARGQRHGIDPPGEFELWLGLV